MCLGCFLATNGRIFLRWEDGTFGNQRKRDTHINMYSNASHLEAVTTNKSSRTHKGSHLRRFESRVRGGVIKQTTKWCARSPLLPPPLLLLAHLDTVVVPLPVFELTHTCSCSVFTVTATAHNKMRTHSHSPLLLILSHNCKCRAGRQ